MKTFTKWIHTLVLTMLLVACENQKDQVFTPTTFTVEEAYEFLLDAGFMTDAPKGQRGYNPKALHKESAEDLLGLITTLAPNKEPALVFYLEVAGATLPNEKERELFITQWTDKIPWFATDIVTAINFELNNPEQQIISEAIDHLISSLSTEQTIALLVRQSFIRENMGPDGNGNGEYTILEDGVEHWSANYMLQCADNIRKEQPGENLLVIAEALEQLADTKVRDEDNR
tara:strand:- start:39939 stop:40628 length:690 start_codon:yes stop_codon:yes gene_type:complete